MTVSCFTCKDAGWLFCYPAPGDYTPRYIECPCRKTTPDARTTRQARSGIDGLESKTLATFRAEIPGVRHAVAAASAYAQVPNGWLYLSGAPGCGKTHLAAAIVNAVLADDREAMFYTAVGFLDYLKAAFDDKAGDTLSKRADVVQNCPLLVLDDLGTEKASEWVRERMFLLLNHRYQRNLATVITSNYSLDELAQRGYEPRLISRLRDRVLCQRIEMTAKDYRQRTLEQRQERTAA